LGILPKVHRGTVAETLTEAESQVDHLAEADQSMAAKGDTAADQKAVRMRLEDFPASERCIEDGLAAQVVNQPVVQRRRQSAQLIAM
jgi:hypothetical protein